MPNNIKEMLKQNYKKTAIFKLYESFVLDSSGGDTYIDFNIPKPNFKYSKAYFKFYFGDVSSYYGKLRVVLDNNINENKVKDRVGFPAVNTHGGHVWFRIEEIYDTKITVLYKGYSLEDNPKIGLEEVIFIE